MARTSAVSPSATSSTAPTGEFLTAASYFCPINKPGTGLWKAICVRGVLIDTLMRCRKSNVCEDRLGANDRVLVGDNTYSEVYAFGHKDNTAVSTFVSIGTSANQTITLSPNHYIYANSKLVAASAVVLGDVLIAAAGSEVTVVAVSQERSTGLFNLHTLQGDIVVSGAKASSYTAVVDRTLAHSLL